jgi:hypothetical protein
MNTEELITGLEPALLRYAREVETGQAWSSPKPAPAFRFVDDGRSTAGKSVDVTKLRESLGLPSKVEAKKPKEDDSELLLVYGSDGELVDIELVHGDHQQELHKKTQALIDPCRRTAPSRDSEAPGFRRESEVG